MKVRLLLFLLIIVTGVSLGAGLTLSASKTLSVEKGPDPIIIDTGGEINMSKCAPCHRNLNAFLERDWGGGLSPSFRHEVHFQRGIRCAACHTEWPHQKSKLIKPKMEACIVCHRLEHGNQRQIAPSASNCNLCHPPGFKLKPDNHVAHGSQLKGRTLKEPALFKQYKSLSPEQTQKCLVCHSGNFCQDCHDQENVRLTNGNGQFRYLPLWPKPKAKGVKIVIDNAPVAMGKCNPCHTNLELWQNDKLVNFKHRVHFKRQITCSKCHDSWPHQVGQVKKPKMTACIKCHRLSHGNQGRLVAAENSSYPPEYCNLCHPPSMNLKPAFHTAEFIGGGHKDWAKKDRGLCRGCHIQSFCDSCHQTEIPHPEGWRTAHGREVASVESTQGENLFCFKCHLLEGPKVAYKKAPSCGKCHRAVVYPHKQPWAPVHGKIAKTEGKAVCYTCHQSYQFCQGCHGSVKVPHPQNWIGQHRAVLQNENVEVCLRCHNKQQCEFCHERHAVHNRNSIYRIDE